MLEVAIDPFNATHQPHNADETFLALSRAIQRADGFTLLIVVCNEPVQQWELLHQLDAVLAEPALRVSVPTDCDDVLPVVESSLPNDRAVSAVIVTELAAGIRSESPQDAKLQALNHRREEWRAQVPFPVVFWIPEYLLQPLALQAPDFLDWRSGTFLFLKPLATARDYRTGTSDHSPEVWRLTQSERLQRMEQLRELLAALSGRSDHPRDPAAIRWLLELAAHHQQLGQLQECVEIARDQVLPNVPSDDARNRAYACSLIADVLQARGELDEALRIRREEQLPVYERLGDVRAKAVTQGKIADVLQARGELDEALRIRREEELPVYERLGDVRSKAVTQGQIADVLQARGELDEALRIRREEQLPVYERLGDVRGRRSRRGRSRTCCRLGASWTRPSASAARKNCPCSSGSATSARRRSRRG
ncbi:MAG: tetratricopeptide repeat protein [Planctomycetaceae bacterium]